MIERRFDYMCLYGLDSDELKSVLKNNILQWKERRNIKILLAQEEIKELIPLMAIVGVASIVTELIKNSYHKTK